MRLTVFNLLSIFISAWSGATITSAIRRSSGKPLPFVDRPQFRRQFAQLSTRNDEDQKRVLREAAAVAFRSWRVPLQGLPVALFMALGFAAAEVLPSALGLPERIWLRAAVAGLVGAISYLPTELLMAAYLRPFLRQVLRDEVSLPNPSLPTGCAGA